MRTKRVHQPKTLVHVISRFVDDRFELDVPGAREQCLARMADALGRADWILLAYALMSSHLHWAMLVGVDEAQRIFKSLNSGLAGWLNRSNGRHGPVFTSRPKIIPVPRSRFGYLAAYIHNNPVRAQTVATATESTWTSHRSYLGLAPGFPGLDTDLGLALAGFDSTGSGRRQFDALVNARSSDSRDPIICGDVVADLRAQVRRREAAPVELVDPRVDSFGDTIGLADLDALVPSRPVAGLTVPEVTQAVERITGVSAGELASRSRVRRITTARALALVVWTRWCSQPQTVMARTLGISDAAATQLLARHEAELWDLARRAAGRS